MIVKLLTIPSNKAANKLTLLMQQETTPTTTVTALAPLMAVVIFSTLGALVTKLSRPSKNLSLRVYFL